MWDPSKVAIRLGVNYTGLIRRDLRCSIALNASEVGMVFASARTRNSSRRLAIGRVRIVP